MQESWANHKPTLVCYHESLSQCLSDSCFRLCNFGNSWLWDYVLLISHLICEHSLRWRHANKPTDTHTRGATIPEYDTWTVDLSTDKQGCLWVRIALLHIISTNFSYAMYIYWCVCTHTPPNDGSLLGSFVGILDWNCYHWICLHLVGFQN